MLLDVHGGQLFAANAVGARIWQLAEERRSVAEIAADIVSTYAVDAGVAERDVEAFLASLVARRLLAEEPRP